MTEVFVTSDLHFGHKNIIRFCNRPFASVEEMDEGIINIWNSRVGPKDHVYHLGDLSFDRRHTNPAALADLLARLNGTKTFILGNHDRGIAQGLKGFRGLSGAVGVHDYWEARHGETKIVMFHYPITEWNGCHRGAVHFHGHCHGSRKELAGALLDVGLDAHPNFMLWEIGEAVAAAQENQLRNPAKFGHSD